MKIQHTKYYDISIIVGDINFDNNRFPGHTQAVNNYLDEKGLSSVWEFIPVDFTFSTENSFSTIDHFLISTNHSCMILDAGSIHDSKNMSRHCPIYLKVDIKMARNLPEKNIRNPKPSWSLSTPEQHNM